MVRYIVVAVLCMTVLALVLYLLAHRHAATQDPNPAPGLVNGCDRASAVSQTGKDEVEIGFGGPFGYRYEPSCIAVSVGCAVKFVGNFAAHPLAPGTINGSEVAVDERNPILPTVAGGEALFVAPEPGMYGYYCDKHVGEAMIGAVFVE